jgi:enamine deaminase RidA (YjgF/YER057c/UK114 family)
MTIKRFNPSTIPAPSGSYIHGIDVPASARILFIAGQTPGRDDGSVPENFEEQVEVVWKRIGAILEEAGMDFSHLVKVTTFVTKQENLSKTSAIRKRILGDNRPTATLLCISGLADPRYGVEIEAIAAKE